MRLIANFIDKEFKDNGYSHVRKIVRGIVYNDNFEIALVKCEFTDIFGERDLFETPGGGVEKGETLINAFKREIKEEVGAEIEYIEEIGRVVDFYNLIHRKNNNHYYLAHIKSIGETHWTESENHWFEGIHFMSIDKAIYEYEHSRDLPVNNIVRQRELPILKIAKKRLDLMKEKRDVRNAVLSKRSKILHKLEKNRNVKEQLLPILNNYETIGIYASMNDEVDTYDIIITLLNNGKSVCLPKVVDHNLVFFEIKSLNELAASKGKYKIKEPIANNVKDKKDIDVMVIPGVAFDSKNNRLGFSKGYYDRYLKDYKGYKIGICYKEQLLEKIPHNSRDIKMDKVIFDK